MESLVEEVYQLIKPVIDKVEPFVSDLNAVIEDTCTEAHATIINKQDENYTQLEKQLGTLYYIKQLVDCMKLTTESINSMHSVDESSISSDDDLVAAIARFSPITDDFEPNKVQQLILYLLNTAQSKGYRKFADSIYERVKTNGYNTHAWSRICSIMEYIHMVTRKEVNFDMWLNMTSVRSNINFAADHLQSCNDVQLPSLMKDRHIFSFKNGIYLADKDQFVTYGTPEHNALPSHLVSSKYFDNDMNTDDVSTPHFDAILDYQDMSTEVKEWMYVLIGRLIYYTNELDTWQIIPFLKGAASSGKSTILLHICRNLYDICDVGTMSNNIERKFGIGALSTKFIFIGPEIKSDFGLEQAEFQSIVSGETVQVAVKYQTAQTVDWDVPGILAGNEVPNFVDNSGSINRRIVLFEFPKRVKDGDMELGKKLQAEMPKIIIKCNKAYLNAVKLYAKDNIWKHLPTEFHKSKEDLSENVNSIMHFLKSGQLSFDASKYMPFETFAGMYNAYVDSMQLQKMRLVGDKVSHPLLEMGCKIVKNQAMMYPRVDGSIVNGRFILGLDYAQ